MAGHISDGETAPEIPCRPRSMTSAIISEGNKRSHPVCMNTVIKHILDGRRLGKETRYIRTPMYRHPAPLEWSVMRQETRYTRSPFIWWSVRYATMQAQHSHRMITHSSAIPWTDPPTPQQPREVYIRRASRPLWTLLSPSKDLNAFLTIHL